MSPNITPLDTTNNFDLAAVLGISFVLLMTSALTGTFIAYPLLVALGLLIAALLKRGFTLTALIKMAFHGRKTSPTRRLYSIVYWRAYRCVDGGWHRTGFGLLWHRAKSRLDSLCFGPFCSAVVFPC